MDNKIAKLRRSKDSGLKLALLRAGLCPHDCGRKANIGMNSVPPCCCAYCYYHTPRVSSRYSLCYNCPLKGCNNVAQDTEAP